MIKSNQYIITVKAFFFFLELEFGMKVIKEKKRGNFFYDIQYKDKTKIISISYENIEDYLQVIIFKLENDGMPDYDDKSKTLHLNRLNEFIMSRVDKDTIILNAQFFSKYNAKDKLERRLLKKARELRLCLNYLNQLQIL